MRDDFIDDEHDILDDDDGAANIAETHLPAKVSGAWRSIERLREMKELRKHLDDFISDEMAEDQDDMRI